MSEGRAALLERAEVARFIIGDAIVPTAPEDAQPFEGEGAQDGVMRFAGTTLLVIIGVGPFAVTTVCPAHSTKVWRRNFGACQRQWVQIWRPLFSRTGATPLYFCRLEASG